MEGKTVILSVLITILVMAQIQVDAKSCCPNFAARTLYNTCRFKGGYDSICADMSACKIVDGSTCSDGYEFDILKNTGDADNEYCKLGCASSVCGALTTLQNSDASEIVNGAVEKCAKTCSAICTKGSMTAVETA